MFVGGLRALLLQSLHPLAMAGVAQHSDYRTDPWGRLQRTADFLAATTFGPASQAQRAVDTVHRVHERVTGSRPDGRPVRSERSAPARVGPPRRARQLPRSARSLRRAPARRRRPRSIRRRRRRRGASPRRGRSARVGDGADRTDPALPRSELRGTTEAREAARHLLIQPPLPFAARPAYALIAGAAVALMPTWTRMPLRLPWLPVSETVALRPAGELVTRTIRWADPGPLLSRHPAALPTVGTNGPDRPRRRSIPLATS